MVVSKGKQFRLVIIFVLTLLILAIAIILCYRFQVIPHRQYSDADFGITTYRSSIDQDGDGIDDQTDILESAKSYLATQPKYKSIYYASGYPDDEHGVCTDVIAFALLGAGYDLMQLVDADIAEHPEAYDVEVRDAKIDFRRVKNLEVYFRRHAKSLTTNLAEISEWQAGDIVIFRDHIGIISDHRNRRGVPFLLHHYSPFQITYEEDCLENYPKDYIVGHYRVS